MECYPDSTGCKLWMLIAGVLLLCTLVLGCQSPQHYSSASEAEAESSPLSSTLSNSIGMSASEAEAEPLPRVALLPGDVIEVKFFYTPQLNENQMVRPDGKITLQLVGEVEVQGKTPAELREELLKLYAPHLQENYLEIVVIVRSLQDRRIFVGGQVMAPGIVEMPGKINVLQAIMQAGGFKLPDAEVRNVVVVRHKYGQRYAYSINLEPPLSGDGSQPFYLEAQDIVYVPRTMITKVDQWVDQHINKLMPRPPIYFGVAVE